MNGRRASRELFGRRVSFSPLNLIPDSGSRNTRGSSWMKKSKEVRQSSILSGTIIDDAYAKEIEFLVSLWTETGLEEEALLAKKSAIIQEIERAQEDQSRNICLYRKKAEEIESFVRKKESIEFDINALTLDYIDGFEEKKANIQSMKVILADQISELQEQISESYHNLSIANRPGSFSRSPSSSDKIPEALKKSAESFHEYSSSPDTNFMDRGVSSMTLSDVNDESSSFGQKFSQRLKGFSFRKTRRSSSEKPNDGSHKPSPRTLRRSLSAEMDNARPSSIENFSESDELASSSCVKPTSHHSTSSSRHLGLPPSNSFLHIQNMSLDQSHAKDIHVLLIENLEKRVASLTSKCRQLLHKQTALINEEKNLINGRQSAIKKVKDYGALITSLCDQIAAKRADINSIEFKQEKDGDALLHLAKDLQMVETDISLSQERTRKLVEFRQAMEIRREKLETIFQDDSHSLDGLVISDNLSFMYSTGQSQDSQPTPGSLIVTSAGIIFEPRFSLSHPTSSREFCIPWNECVNARIIPVDDLFNDLKSSVDSLMDNSSIVSDVFLGFSFSHLAKNHFESGFDLSCISESVILFKCNESDASSALQNWIHPFILEKGFSRIVSLEHSSTILQTLDFKEIAVHVPQRYRYSSWRLLYNLNTDGMSLSMLYKNVASASCLITILQDGHRRIFGSYTSETWKPRHGFYGSGECFVWEIHPFLRVYPWAEKNSLFQYSRENVIAIGGGNASAFRIDHNLEFGSSNPCETFDNPTLSSSSEFKIISMEVWAPTDD